jgi:hypothetical protein
MRTGEIYGEAFKRSTGDDWLKGSGTRELSAMIAAALWTPPAVSLNVFPPSCPEEPTPDLVESFPDPSVTSGHASVTAVNGFVPQNAWYDDLVVDGSRRCVFVASTQQSILKL